MKTYSITGNGCEALLFDGQKIADLLQLYGIQENTDGSPDILVILGCTFTQRQEDDFRMLVEDATHYRKIGQIIIVSGCYLKYEKREGVIYTRKENLSEVLDDLFTDKKGGELTTLNKNRAMTPYVAISEGCYGSCTFCSVRIIRGFHRSRDRTTVLTDVRRAAKIFGTVKLVGQEIAAYGRDIGTTLPELIQLLFEEFPDLQLELGSLGLAWMKLFSDEELEVFADKRIQSNIHLPLQSASDSVLKQMKRRHTFSDFDKLLKRLISFDIQRFSTDLMAGFPSESESDHKNNLMFLKKYRFQFAQIFMYESRPGTTAAGMVQIPRETRVRRTLELIGTYVANHTGFRANENIDIDDILNTNIEIAQEEVIFYES